MAAVEDEGSRQPGLLVVGWACEVLQQKGGMKWVVEEGFSGLDGLDGLDVVGMEGLAGPAVEEGKVWEEAVAAPVVTSGVDVGA